LFLEELQMQTGYNPFDCAEAWLRNSNLPGSELCL